jgi:hypothetical protein
MAKGQKRSNKEQRKPKSEEKKPTGPKYLRPAELVQFAKAGAQSAGSKK